MKQIFDDIAGMQKNIQPLNINGLRGRLLKMPATNKSQAKKEILMVYGSHPSIERMYGMAEVLADGGNVMMPDLPGMGGMDSFYKIGMKPTLDNMADYLATFVKLKYRNKKVTIVGVSLGFVIVTRMLQKYPDLTKRVNILISAVGFSHKDDFRFTRRRWRIYTAGSWALAHRIPAFLFKNIALHPSLIRAVYARTHNAKHKFKGIDSDTVSKLMEFEITLWRVNDVRTHWRMAYEMLSINNCDVQVDLPVHHISAEKDQYFDNAVVEQHMRIIYSDYINYPINPKAHSPSVIANKAAAQEYVPKKLRKVMSE